jgi:hypothetical protein
MSALAKLRFVTSKRNTAVSPAVHRRNKLVTKIDEQIALVEARLNGVTYAPTKTRTAVDSNTGLRARVEVPKRVKEWFWIGDKGRIQLQVRYGARVIELAKGKNAIEVSSVAELLEALKLVREAVISGDVDSHIEAACSSLRAGFKK